MLQCNRSSGRALLRIPGLRVIGKQEEWKVLGDWKVGSQGGQIFHEVKFYWMYTQY